MEQKTKDSLAIGSGIIWIDGEVTWKMQDWVVGMVAHHMSSSNNKKFRELLFPIDSGGGDLEAGLAIYDLITAYPGKTKTIVFPYAASAAATILQAGKVRMSTPGARILFHNPKLSGVKFDDIESDEAFDKLRKNIGVIKGRLHSTLSRLKLGREELNGLCKEDRMMFPAEALEIRAIDKIEAHPFK